MLRTVKENVKVTMAMEALDRRLLRLEPIDNHSVARSSQHLYVLVKRAAKATFRDTEMAGYNRNRAVVFSRTAGMVARSLYADNDSIQYLVDRSSREQTQRIPHRSGRACTSDSPNAREVKK